MTPEQWIERMKGMNPSDGRVLFFATTATMATMQERIWGRGELSDGGKLAYEEDYQVYIYKPPFPRAPNGKGKTGRAIKGQWEPTYLAAKAAQDRGGLPFELTGDMRIAWGGGTVPIPREVDPLLCEIVMDAANARKAKGLAKQKGDFLRLTRAERQEHAANVAKAYREQILGTL
jgi:hypothetical protein